MKVGIMQPTYLPWLGYFDMMSRVDVFVLLDNVQFEKKSWQQRNRIKTANGELMLSVPVRTAGRFHQQIDEVEIDRSTRFHDKHVKSIEAAYRKAPFFASYAADLATLIGGEETLLSRFNEAIIRALAGWLGVMTPIVVGSDLAATGSSTELTVNQCLELGATSFLAAGGSRPYVSAEPRFAEHGITVEFHEYEHPQYQQLHGEFVPYMAAIDAILNVGPDAGALLTGRS